VVYFSSAILVAIPVVYYGAKAISKKFGIEMLDIDIESYSSVVYIVCLILGLTLVGVFAIPEWLKKKIGDIATKGILKSCPQCKALSGIPIVYGYPSECTLQKVRNGEIALGGCIVRSSNPRWQCKKCGCMWGGKPRKISANKNTARGISSLFIGNRFRDKRNQKVMQDKWEYIGGWEEGWGSSHFEGYVPNWIKKKISSVKRRKFILRNGERVTYARDKHYQYKLVLSTGDEINSITIYRKRRFFIGAKNVRRKSKSKA